MRIWKLDPQLRSVSQINLLEFDDEFCAIRIIWSSDGELEKHLTFIIETMNINQETVYESLQLCFSFSKLSVVVESGVQTMD
jgi:hypothetical protein